MLFYSSIINILNLSRFKAVSLLAAGLYIELAFSPFTALRAEAQVVPDSSSRGSLSTSVRDGVSPGSIVVEEGIQRGENLFHSFEQFSISPDQSVLFSHPESVERIFGRVTGGEISVIDGFLGIQGTTDLFLINPAGILFGPNAVIQTNGSLIVSTARRVIFADELEFLAEPESVFDRDLLSIAAPVEFYFSGNSPIFVGNTGHTLSGGNYFFPLQESSPSTGISSFGGTLAFLGGEIDFSGGIARNYGGDIVLGSVREGFVSIFPKQDNWGLAYDDVEQFGAIVLDRFSFIDASGPSGGSISLTGQDVQMLDSSVVLIENLSEGTSASLIEVSAQSLLIDGSVSKEYPLDFGRRPELPVAFVPSSISLDNFSSGSAGNIEIQGNSVLIENGGSIYSRSFGAGSVGNIEVTSGRLLIDGANPQNGYFSTISTGNVGSSVIDSQLTGGLVIDADLLEVTDGGSITSSTFNRGTGGRIEINSERIQVSSVEERLRFPSQISALSLQGGVAPIVGDGGSLDINTGSLIVSEGGAIGTSTDNSGDAGSINIRARDFVEIDGSISSALGPSRIGSDVIQLSQEIKDFFGFSGLPSGQGGSVAISTPKLIVRNNGLLAVQNEGVGSAGSLSVWAQSIQLIDGGQLSASTVRGDGGNIRLNSDTLLVDGGTINATAIDEGNGGNIFIASDGIALLPSSSITANAEQGAGGRVVISSDTLLRSPDSRITATSAAGPELAGVVDIQAPDETPQTDSEIAPDVVEVPDVAVACGEGTGRSEFIITGRGGLPRSPSSIQQSYSGWQSPLSTSATPEPNRTPQVTQAQGWVFNGDGTVSLTAQVPNSTNSAHRTACVSESAQNRS